MATTVRQLLKDGTARLGRIIKDNPRLTAEYLLQSLLQLRKIDLYLEPERQVTAAIEAEFWSKVGRKVDREPLQYIIGETEWYGVTLSISIHDLTPKTLEK